MSEQIMSPEEREELDALLDEAAYDNGVMVPTRFMATRARALLIDADKAGREWAEWVLDAALLSGLQARVKRHLKQDNRTTLGVSDELVIDRAAVFGVRRTNGTGEQWEQVPLPMMTADDLEWSINAADQRIQSDRHNRRMFRKLAKILAQTGEPNVDAALASLGLTLEQALAA